MLHFQKIITSCFKFSDENNIANFVQQIVSVIVQLNLNDHDFQKQSFTNGGCSQMFYKTNVLKNLAKFTRKLFRSVTKLKRDSKPRYFPANSANSLRTPFHKSSLDNCFTIFVQLTKLKKGSSSGVFLQTLLIF